MSGKWAIKNANGSTQKPTEFPPTTINYDKGERVTFIGEYHLHTVARRFTEEPVVEVTSSVGRATAILTKLVDFKWEVKVEASDAKEVQSLLDSILDKIGIRSTSH